MSNCKTPCGACDVGVYSEASMINKKAIAFLSLEEDLRINSIPKCKRHNRRCVGYEDLHKMKIIVDSVAE